MQCFPAALLVIAIPLLAAGLAYALRRWSSIELLIALSACGLVVFLLTRPIEGIIALPGMQIDLDAPLDLLGRALRVRGPDRMPLLLCLQVPQSYLRCLDARRKVGLSCRWAC